MSEHKPHKPWGILEKSPFMVAVALAIIVFVAMVSIRWESLEAPIPAAPTPQAVTADGAKPAGPALPSLEEVSQRLRVLHPAFAASDVTWSGIIHDDAGYYRTIRLEADASLRAYVDAGGAIKAFSLSAPKPETVHGADHMGDLMVVLIMPKGDGRTLVSAGHTLGSIIPTASSLHADTISDMETGGVRFDVTPGALDVTIKASPAA